MKLPLLSISLVLLLTSCFMEPLTGDSYSRGEARRLQQVSYVKIIAMKSTQIQGSNENLGSVLGAVAGGVIGNKLVRDRTSSSTKRRVGAAGGAILGGIVGNRIARKTSLKPAWDITVQSKNGRTFSVVQQKSRNDRFRVGDTVRLIYSASGTARIAK